MAVGDADRADVVALGEQQLQDHLAIFLQAFAVGLDLHALADLGGAGGQQLPGSLHLDQAEPAGADRVDAVEMAERGDPDAGLAGGLEDRLILRR